MATSTNKSATVMNSSLLKELLHGRPAGHQKNKNFDPDQYAEQIIKQELGGSTILSSTTGGNKHKKKKKRPKHLKRAFVATSTVEKAETSFLHGNNLHDYSEKWALQRSDLEMLERQYPLVMDNSKKSTATVTTTIEQLVGEDTEVRPEDLAIASQYLASTDEDNIGVYEEWQQRFANPADSTKSPSASRPVSSSSDFIAATTSSNNNEEDTSSSVQHIEDTKDDTNAAENRTSEENMDNNNAVTATNTNPESSLTATTQDANSMVQKKTRVINAAKSLLVMNQLTSLLSKRLGANSQWQDNYQRMLAKRQAVDHSHQQAHLYPAPVTSELSFLDQLHATMAGHLATTNTFDNVNSSNNSTMQPDMVASSTGEFSASQDVSQPQPSQTTQSRLPPLHLSASSKNNHQHHIPSKHHQNHHSQSASALIDSKKFGFDASFSRPTPRVLHNSSSSSNNMTKASTILALRQELEAAQLGVQELNKRVDANITWVQENCDMSAYAGHLSVRTKWKVKQLATSRLVNVLQTWLTRRCFYSWHRLKQHTVYVVARERSVKYLRMKAVHVFSSVLIKNYVRLCYRRFAMWLKFVRVRIQLEREAAVVEIQRIARGRLARVRVRNITLGRTAVVIQNLFRKTKAMQEIQEKKIFKAQKINATAALLLTKFFKDLVAIRKAKQIVEKKRSAKAATNIQKVFRGRRGRESTAEMAQLKKQEDMERKLARSNSPPKSSHSTTTDNDNSGNTDLEALAAKASSKATTNAAIASSPPRNPLRAQRATKATSNANNTANNSPKKGKKSATTTAAAATTTKAAAAKKGTTNKLPPTTKTTTTNSNGNSTAIPMTEDELNSAVALASTVASAANSQQVTPRHEDEEDINEHAINNENSRRSESPTFAVTPRDEHAPAVEHNTDNSSSNSAQPVIMTMTAANLASLSMDQYPASARSIHSNHSNSNGNSNSNTANAATTKNPPSRPLSSSTTHSATNNNNNNTTGNNSGTISRTMSRSRDNHDHPSSANNSTATSPSRKHRSHSVSNPANAANSSSSSSSVGGGSSSSSSSNNAKAGLVVTQEADSSEAALRIQTLARGKLAKKKVETTKLQQKLETEEKKATAIQKIARGKLARKKVEELSTTANNVNSNVADKNSNHDHADGTGTAAAAAEQSEVVEVPDVAASTQQQEEQEEKGQDKPQDEIATIAHPDDEKDTTSVEKEDEEEAVVNDKKHLDVENNLDNNDENDKNSPSSTANKNNEAGIGAGTSSKKVHNFATAGESSSSRANSPLKQISSMFGSFFVGSPSTKQHPPIVTNTNNTASSPSPTLSPLAGAHINNDDENKSSRNASPSQRFTDNKGSSKNTTPTSSSAGFGGFFRNAFSASSKSNKAPVQIAEEDAATAVDNNNNENTFAEGVSLPTDDTADQHGIIDHFPPPPQSAAEENNVDRNTPMAEHHANVDQNNDDEPALVSESVPSSRPASQQQQTITAHPAVPEKKTAKQAVVNHKTTAKDKTSKPPTAGTAAAAHHKTTAASAAAAAAGKGKDKDNHATTTNAAATKKEKENANKKTTTTSNAIATATNTPPVGSSSQKVASKPSSAKENVPVNTSVEEKENVAQSNSETKEAAILKIQLFVRRFLSRRRVQHKRIRRQSQQLHLARWIAWATVSIQRIARGRMGRKRFLIIASEIKVIRAQKRIASAIQIQRILRGRYARRIIVPPKRKAYEEKKQHQQWIASFQKKTPILAADSPATRDEDVEKKNNNEDNNENNKSPVPKLDFKKKKPAPVTQQPTPAATTTATPPDSNKDKTASASSPNKASSNNLLDAAAQEKLSEIDAKLQELSALEKRIKESEAMVQQQAENAAKKLEEQLKLLEEQTKKAEAERLAQQELLALAAGPINSRRSPYATITATNLQSRQPQQQQQTAAGSTMSTLMRTNGPPTGRSAKSGNYPPNAPRLTFNGQEWVQLWDYDENAYYWWCEASQVAQWEQPGMDPAYYYNNYATNNNYNANSYTTNSNTANAKSGIAEDRDDAVSVAYSESSTGAMTDVSMDQESVAYYEDVDHAAAAAQGWHEYWDESAQAKYWYNEHSGEASWTLPESLQTRPATTALSAPASARATTASNTQKNKQSTATDPASAGWVSYLDEETGQLYWHNVHTGEVRWDV